MVILGKDIFNRLGSSEAHRDATARRRKMGNPRIAPMRSPYNEIFSFSIECPARRFLVKTLITNITSRMAILMMIRSPSRMCLQ